MNKLTVEMTDGFSIHAFVSVPASEPKGHIHLLHGMAEHIARYEEFSRFLVSKGYIVSGHDHRGHGKTAESNGELGYFTQSDGFERIVQDVHEVILDIRKQHTSSPFILLGHSMGSFIARRYLQLHKEQIDLAILSGTGSDPGLARVAAQSLALMTGKVKGFDQPNPLLNKLAFGSFNKSVKKPDTEFDWLSRDRQIVHQYIEDPTCGFIPTTQLFADLFHGIKIINTLSEVKKMSHDLPVLFVSGTEDPVGDYGKGVMKVAKQFDEAGIKDVTVKLFEEGRHEMLNETNRQLVYDYILDWIEQKE